MREYIVNIENSYNTNARIILGDHTYFFVIRKYSDNSGLLLEIYDVNEVFLHSEVLHPPEGLIDWLNILKLPALLLYTLDLEENIITFIFDEE